MRRLLSVSALACAMLSLLPAPALACTCMGGMPVCEQLWFGAEEFPRNIFEGTVVSITVETAPRDADGIDRRYRQVTFRDLRGWMGEPGTVVTTSMDDASCGFDFEIGRRYVVDAYRNQATGALGASICSLTRKIEDAGELLAYLESLSKPSRGGRAFGTVEQSSGSPFLGSRERAPMAGVRVILNGPRSTNAATDASGAFSFPDLPPGRYQLSVEVEGRPELKVPPTEEFTIPNAHACHRSWVRLAVDGTIEGAVVDAAGAPVAGVWLALRPAEQSPQDIPTSHPTRADELGRFAFGELPPGRYVVGVNLSLGPRRESPYAITYAGEAAGSPEVIELGLGELRQLRPIVVTRLEPTTAAGQVVWADGTPAAGCVVSASPLVEGRPGMGFGAPTTDANGRFELELFKGVPYRFRAGNCTRNFVELDRVGGDGFVQIVMRDRR